MPAPREEVPVFFSLVDAIPHDVPGPSLRDFDETVVPASLREGELFPRRCTQGEAR